MTMDDLLEEVYGPGNERIAAGQRRRTSYPLRARQDRKSVRKSGTLSKPLPKLPPFRPIPQRTNSGPIPKRPFDPEAAIKRGAEEYDEPNTYTVDVNHARSLGDYE